MTDVRSIPVYESDVPAALAAFKSYGDRCRAEVNSGNLHPFKAHLLVMQQLTKDLLEAGPDIVQTVSIPTIDPAVLPMTSSEPVSEPAPEPVAVAKPSKGKTKSIPDPEPPIPPPPE